MYENLMCRDRKIVYEFSHFSSCSKEDFGINRITLTHSKIPISHIALDTSVKMEVYSKFYPINGIYG